MKKIGPILVAVTLLASLFTIGCPPPRAEEAPPATITIIDSAGRLVEIPQPVERIAVASSGAAEIIRALGATDTIVGVTRHMATTRAYFWPYLKDKPQIGTAHRPEHEQILAVEPQVFIAMSRWGGLEEAVEKLEPAGITVVAIDGFRLETLSREIKTLGLILGKERESVEFANFLQSKIDLIEEKAGEIPIEERKTVYWEMGHRDFRTAGPGSSAHELLTRAGGINIFADLGVPFGDADPEEILIRDPDVIIKGPHGSRVGGFLATCPSDMAEKRAGMMARAGWNELTAVRDGRVYIFGGGIGGPRRVVILTYIAKLLYPDIFADVDVEAFHRELFERQGVEFGGIYLYPPVD
ncbi:ABC transporter substrate-binding protein [Dehalococcoidia bacterium]|nr:ABC transporter substrate-binding protein [Dehalococcoidia bacterium]